MITKIADLLHLCRKELQVQLYRQKTEKDNSTTKRKQELELSDERGGLGIRSGTG